MNWVPIAITMGRTLGKILLSILMQLLTGKFLKYLILLPFQKWASWTKNTEDDKLVEKAREDLDL